MNRSRSHICNPPAHRNAKTSPKRSSIIKTGRAAYSYSGKQHSRNETSQTDRKYSSAVRVACRPVFPSVSFRFRRGCESGGKAARERSGNGLYVCICRWVCGNVLADFGVGAFLLGLEGFFCFCFAMECRIILVRCAAWFFICGMGN